MSDPALSSGLDNTSANDGQASAPPRVTIEPILLGRSLGMAARHSSKSNEHYTPPSIVEPARATMGDLDLDPASCELANTVVQAARYYTSRCNGLGPHWEGRVFLNPPGGRVEGASSQKTWWFKLAAEWMAGRATEAIFVGFSVEILQTTQVKRLHGLPVPTELPHCFPARRVAYLKEVDGKLVPGTSPPHSSVIIYLPPRRYVEWYAGVARFRAAFEPIGALCGPLGGERWMRGPCD